MTRHTTTWGTDPFGYSAWNKNAIGFEDIVSRLKEAAMQVPQLPTYPPYNIRKVDDDHYVIEVAVAGFGKSELDVETKENVLTVTGKWEGESIPPDSFLHKGIAARPFTRSWTLADNIVVQNAEMLNGLLRVYLEQFVPEEKKAKKIPVNDADPGDGGGGSKPQLLTEEDKKYKKVGLDHHGGSF